MKQIVIYISEITLCGLVVCFCLQMLFQGEGEMNPLNLAQDVANQYQVKELVSENEVRLKQVLDMPVPEVKLQGGGYSMGEKISFLSCVQVKYGEEWIPVAEAEGTTLEIFEITDKYGNSVRSEFFAEGNAFHERGRYQVTIRVISPYGRSVEKVLPFFVG